MSLNVIRTHSAALLPARATAEAAGYDLYSPVDFVLPHNSVTVLPLGLKIQVPPGTYGQIHDRSSMALKGIFVRAGVIDRDYRGDVGVVFHNSTEKEYLINHKDRVAQFILHNISTVSVVEVKELSATARGEGGFGSTGV